MSLRVFISRNLNPESPVNQIKQSHHQAEVIAESMLHIESIEIPSLPVADWFFFYSKNGVEYFARQWKAKWQDTTHHPIRWGAMGQGTADVMSGWGMNSDFIGQGEAEEIAEQFLEHCKPSDSVLFFRAYHSRDRLHKIIAQHRDSTSIPIYDNQMLRKKFPPVDIGIFTSSRNAIAFLEHNAQPAIVSIAIGEPTAATLRTFRIPEEKIRVAHEPSEEAIYTVLLDVVSGLK